MDPNSSRKNESLYAFCAREVVEGHVSSWNREISRISKKYGSETTWAHKILLNKMTAYLFIHICLGAAIYYIFGWTTFKHQLVYSVWGIFWLDFIMYITHYGLSRKADKNGIYEPINKYHSWNHKSSLTWWRLQRHSDHHCATFRPYQILRRQDDAPWSPFQYELAFLISLNPPLWFYIMNPKADAVMDHLAGKKPKVAFNSLQETTSDDKFRIRCGQAWCIFITVVMSYYIFFDQTFNVLANRM